MEKWNIDTENGSKNAEKFLGKNGSNDDFLEEQFVKNLPETEEWLQSEQAKEQEGENGKLGEQEKQSDRVLRLMKEIQELEAKKKHEADRTGIEDFEQYDAVAQLVQAEQNKIQEEIDRKIEEVRSLTNTN